MYSARGALYRMGNKYAVIDGNNDTDKHLPEQSRWDSWMKPNEKSCEREASWHEWDWDIKHGSQTGNTQLTKVK